MRKRFASVGEAREEIWVEAVTRERVVLWTILWARSSKTVDCGLRCEQESTGSLDKD